MVSQVIDEALSVFTHPVRCIEVAEPSIRGLNVALTACAGIVVLDWLRVERGMLLLRKEFLVFKAR